MNLDSKDIEINGKSWIEKKISNLMNEIEKEFKFKWNTLEKLLSFKFYIEKREAIKTSNEFRSALISEIEKKANFWEIVSNDNEKLNQAKYELLANKIIEISKLTKEIQAWIRNLRSEILNDAFKEEPFLTSSSLITKRLYWEDLLKRIDNPESFGDQLIWLWVASIETLAIVWKFIYDLWKDIILSPYHLVQIIRWKAKYDWIEI